MLQAFLNQWQGAQQLNTDNSSTDMARESSGSTEKKPYKTPAFRYEPVFEVSALSCGKLSSTQSGCRLVTKAS